jgi:hypothetical protein
MPQNLVVCVGRSGVDNGAEVFADEEIEESAGAAWAAGVDEDRAAI